MSSGEGFHFQQFFVRHDRCAMKVGTDGVLLGALAEGGCRILDIGTGTGLCALMMAQRFPSAVVTAIDIDHDACLQATENVSDSSFDGRIEVIEASLKDFATASSNAQGTYDAIITNPPYFEEDLMCPDTKRNDARHTSSLPFSELVKYARQLLTDDGVLTIILPAMAVSRMEEECAYMSMFINMKILIKTTEKKQPKRAVLYITKHPHLQNTDTVVLSENGERSAWYQEITKAFYLPIKTIDN